MTPKELQNALALAEKSAGTLTEALLQGEAGQAEVAARALHQAAASLSEGLLGIRGGGSPAALELRRRLARIAQSLAMQREACARRGAVVDMALNAIVPATRASTYAGAGPYGRSAKQSGAFKLLSA